MKGNQVQTYHELKAELTLFSNAARAKYGSDSYACGYLESTLVTVLQDMPKRKREALLAAFRKTTAELELK